jgi:hypothetical protein
MFFRLRVIGKSILRAASIVTTTNMQDQLMGAIKCRYGTARVIANPHDTPAGPALHPF